MLTGTALVRASRRILGGVPVEVGNLGGVTAVDEEQLRRTVLRLWVEVEGVSEEGGGRRSCRAVEGPGPSPGMRWQAPNPGRAWQDTTVLPRVREGGGHRGRVLKTSCTASSGDCSSPILLRSHTFNRRSELRTDAWHE